MFAQTVTIVRKPICPTYIHDDTTRLIIILIALPILIGIHWAIIRYFNAT